MTIKIQDLVHSRPIPHDIHNQTQVSMAPTRSTNRKASGNVSTLPKSTPAPTFKRTRVTKATQLKQIFRGMEMSLSGSFTGCDKSLPHDQIAKWITLHGGSFEREVTDNTTHLICSIEDYKKSTPQGNYPLISLASYNFYLELSPRIVKKASKLEECRIVVFDWLEDCLARKVKRLRAERGYTLERTMKRIAKGANDQERFQAKFEEGVQVGREFCDNSND